MPKSKIEAEFVKATKVDPDDYKNRQDFFVAIVEKVNTFKDAQWDKLSEAAQDWINAAVKKVKAKKRVAEFDDVGSVPDDDDEKPAKKKKAKAEAEDDEDEESEDDESEDEDDDEDEEEDEKPAKKKKKKAAEEDDEDEDEKPAKKKKKAKPADDDEDEEEDDEDEKPAKKKKKSKAADEDEDEDEEEDDEKPAKKKKKAKAEDDDEDEEEDEKPAKKKKADKIEAKPTGVKVAIKTLIIADPEITVDALIKKLGKGGAPVSKVTVSNVRAEFRHTLKVLKELGKLKGVDF